MNNNKSFYSPCETMPKAQLRALQEQRLVATVARTDSKSPMFHQFMNRAGVRSADFQSIADFVEKVPVFDNDAGEPVADGEVVEMVVTNIADPFLAMVRYRTDDLIVVVNRETCSCGRTHTRFKMRGRAGD